MDKAIAESSSHFAVYRQSLRVIAALVLREMSTRYGRTPGGYIWAIVEPVAMILILSAAFKLFARAPSLGTSFILFKATGMMILQIYSTLGNTVGRSLSFSKPLLFYPRVNWLDAVIARLVLNALLIWLITAIILAGTMVFEQIGSPINWGSVVLAVALATLMGLGWGVLNCFLFNQFPVWENFWAIVTRPLFLISGVIILYEEMPQFAQNILWYNPILHITGLMRDGFYPLYQPNYISVVYVLFWALIPLLFGLLLMRKHHQALLNK